MEPLHPSFARFDSLRLHESSFVLEIRSAWGTSRGSGAASSMVTIPGSTRLVNLLAQLHSAFLSQLPSVPVTFAPWGEGESSRLLMRCMHQIGYPLAARMNPVNVTVLYANGLVLASCY